MTPPKRSRVRDIARSTMCALSGVALVATLVAGCGGDDTPSASVRPQDGSGAVSVVAEGASFSVERIEVQSATTTTIVLDNRDSVAHTLTVYVANAPNGETAADTGEVAAGESGEAVVFFSGPGEHAYRCVIHAQQMAGTIVVQ